MSFDSYMKNLRRIEVASVKYTCSCKRTSNLEELFFCGQKGCRQFLCQSCTEQVIDTYYCPSCLNSFFSSTAFQNTNKCQQCRKCPTCFCTLGHMTLEDETFIFHCEYCKWRSDSVGLVADQIKGLFAKCKEHEQQSDGDEKESPKKYFEGLLENYGGKFQENLKRNNAFFEEDGMKLEKKEPIERFEPTGDVRVAMERIDELLANKQKGLLRLPKEDVENTFVGSGEGGSKMAEKDFNINNVSSLEQRFSNPSFFPSAPDVLWPYGENLQTKVGHKCTKCTRFVLKPKAGATKVSHDIANLAIELFPRATLKDYPKLQTGKKQTVILVLKNPVPEEKVAISFGEIPDEFNEGDLIIVVVDGGKNIAGKIANKKLWKEGMYAVIDDEQKKTALYPKEAVKKAPPAPKGDDDEDEDKEDDEDKPLEDTPLTVNYKGKQTAKVVIPKGEVTLDAYDEISEHNESLVEGKANPDDDKNVVAFRMLSRVGFKFTVTPTAKEGDVVFSFVVNVKPNSGSKVLTFQEFQFQATVNLGPVNVETKKET